MAAETIREFLVALGFRIDQPTLKKFEDAMTASTLKANLLAASFVGMAKAIAENIQRATKDLESLYYTSIRVGSSATNLKALTQASQDFGVSAEEALGNIESLAQALRTDPGTEAFINHLGVKTRDANHQLRDTVDIANELGQVLAQRPDYMAQQLGELIGLTYRFQKMIRDPGWLADLEKHNRLLEHGGYGQAARDAALLEQQFRELGDRWDSLKKRLEVHIFEPFLQQGEELSKWLDQHGPEIEEFVDGIAHAIDVAFKIIGPLLGKIAEGWHLIFQEVKALGEYLANAFPNIGDKIGAGFGWLIDKLGIKDVIDEELGLKPPSAKPSARIAGRGTAPGIARNNPGNLEYRGQEGAVRAGGGPEDRRFAAFRTPEDGLLAMARQLELDFSRGRTTIEALIAKYAPPEENDTAAYINDVASKMNLRGRSTLNLQDPAVLSSLMNAMILHENMSNPYRPDTVRAAAQEAIGAPVTMNQTNHFTINGAKDPAQTKQAIADALYESNRRMTRNLQPATQ